MIKKLKQFREFSFPQKKVLCLAMLSLPLIALLLHTLGYKRTTFLLSRFMPAESSRHAPVGNELNKVRDLARITHISARHNVYKANCLKQALLIWFLLGRRSISSEIKIGMQKDPDCTFSAHAWVECNGEPLIDSKDTIDRFSAFF